MRKSLKLLSLFLALSMTGSILSACGDNKGDSGDDTNTAETFDYATEMLSKMDNVSTGYNSSLFYVNTLEFQIADPSVIYVTEGEDAGYFYAYGTSDEIGCHGIQAWRSKDLSHWECTGIAFLPDYSVAWAVNNYWAPEVIYDSAEKLYYMFYNAYNMNDNNRLCLSVAYSTSPAGPFISPDGRKDADGNMLSAGKPVYDVTTNNPVVAELDKENPGFAKTHALDASPFIDPATGDRYLYFSYYDDYGEGSFIYGMKMKNWFTPDYTTMTMLTYPGYNNVKAGIDRDITQQASEGNVNEGPFMVYHDGKYYMTFSVFGYQDSNYQVKQAIADSPLGVYEKVSPDDGGKVISTDTVNWSHIVSAGHHSFIQCGDETFIAYHTFKDRNSIAGGRALAVDKVVWMKNNAGQDVMYTNGPTYSVQPLPESLSGYKNIAPSAKVTADKTSSDSDVALLTDEIIKYQDLDLAEEYTADAGVSTIKLEWDNFRTVRGLMVYNSYDYENTFVAIDKVEFEYLKADGSTGKAVIENLEYDWNWNFEDDNLFMRPGGAAIAEFYEMPVKSITITVQSAQGAENLSIGEIIVLGKDTACPGISEFKEYTYSNPTYGSSHIVMDSENFGSVPGTGLSTYYGYDLSHDDGTEDAYIEQNGVSDQYAYFKDVYSTSFYMEAEFTVTADKPFSKDQFPKFGIAISCDDEENSNTIFYYVDAVNYSNQVVGCAQRMLDNTNWDWNATEQTVAVDGIRYTDGNYVKLGVLRLGKEFYLICNDKVVIYYSSFNIFNDEQKAAAGFLSFNTPMKIKNYSVSDDEAVLEEMKHKYADSMNGETFGSAGSYSTTSGWDLTNDRGETPSAVQSSTGDQYAYFKDINSTSFYVETEITVSKDLGDSFPKFGLAARVGDNTLFFYIDGSSNYNAQRVGYVSRNDKGEWAWGTSDNKEQQVDIGKYTDGEYVKLGMLRDGNTFKLYVNDQLIFTVTDVRGFGSDKASVAAVLTFTTGVTIRNYSATTDIASVEK